MCVHGTILYICLLISCACTEFVFKNDKVIENQENRIRIKDIAERARVSVGTVDRVIHKRGEVAEETRKQILSIIEELGYTPNVLAKSLASKKQYQIAALIPEHKNFLLFRTSLCPP